jgi:hypothetical protein
MNIEKIEEDKILELKAHIICTGILTRPPLRAGL